MLSTDLLIREAIAADVCEITRLYRQLVNHPALNILPERLTQLSSDPHNFLWVIERNSREAQERDQEQKLCATALVTYCADVMFGTSPFAVIENVVVDQEERGQGIGLSLLRHIEKTCFAQHCSKIMLLSSLQRKDAHRFFERMGFKGNTKRGFVKYRSDSTVLF